MNDAARTRWRRIQALCEALEDVPAASRLERLRALEPDVDVQRETLLLLQAIEDEAREREHHRQPPSDAGAPLSPAHIGGVRIETYIGSGGSGEVYSFSPDRYIDSYNQLDLTVSQTWRDFTFKLNV